MLEDEINNCKQNGQSVLEYYGRLSNLWEELQNFTTSTTCTCSAAAIIDKEPEDARVHKFLFGLDETRFSTIRSHVIDEDPLPDLNTVYSRVIRAEQHLFTMRAKEIKNDAVGFLAQADSSTNTLSAASQQRSRDPNRSCTHCNRKGHEAVECFLLHGYPDWFLEQQQQLSASSGQRGRGGRGARGRGRANLSRTLSL